MFDVDIVARKHLLSGYTPLWWPGLTALLIKARQNRPASDLYPSCIGYSTTQYLLGGENSECDVFWVGNKSSPDHLSFRIEYLHENVTKHPLFRGKELATPDEIREMPVDSAISKASALIKTIPSLATSIQHLTQSVHIVRQKDPAYDVSFSEPFIPFSIFISIPGESLVAAARVAEAIIHESMHLQLSLVEQLVPLGIESTKRQYSPWKQEPRPISGLIHALYVFSIIDEWLRQLLSLYPSISSHILNRRNQILSEVEEIDFVQCKALSTLEGQALLSSIDEHFRQR